MTVARLVVAAGLASCLGLDAQLTPIERKLHVDSFEHVWKTVRDTHWDPKMGGVDWQAVHRELRPKMDRVQNRAEARAVLSEMLARLKLTHFGILPVDVYGQVSSPGGAGEGRTGMEIRVVKGQQLVVAVDPGSPAERKGIRPGWVLLKADGADLFPALELIEKTYAASTLRDLMLDRAVISKLSGDVGSRVRVTLLDGQGSQRAIELDYAEPRGNPARFGLLPPQHVWIEWKRQDPLVGYIAFNLFLDPARLMPAFEDALKSFSGTRGVIVDLRGNPGGIGIMAMGVAGWFIDKPEQRLGTMHTRQAPLQFVVNPRFPTYTGRVAILIDGTSASTAEIFAGGMKDLKRARIFGSRSAGAALPSVIERLPNGDAFQYAAANYISEGGKALEGNGVIPDVEVQPSREALLRGKDSVIEAASDWIRSSNQGQ